MSTTTTHVTGPGERSTPSSTRGGSRVRTLMARAWKILRRAVRDFIDDDCFALAAAVAYYTLFSLPPMLVIVLAIAGGVAGPDAAEGQMYDEFQKLLGPGGADQVAGMLRAARAEAASPSLVRAALGITLLIIGATGAFVQLQAALNRVWEVRPDPGQGGIKSFLLKRLLSFGTIMVLAFFLVVSLALSAVVTAFGDALERGLPDVIGRTTLYVFDLALSLTLLTGVLALIFRYLPDAKVHWREAFVGGALTALLFTLGKLAIGAYLGRSHVGSAFGAASALAVILVWIYYSSSMLLFGAELTQAWACVSGRVIEPEPGAIRVQEPD